jgi:hypothetical protein
LFLCARSEDIEEFTEEQSLMGRLVHLFKTDSADQQYQVSINTYSGITSGSDVEPESRAEIKLPTGTRSRHYELRLQLRLLSIFHRLEEIL